MGRFDDGFIVRPLKNSLTSLKTLKKRYGSLEKLRSRSESRELFVFLCLGDSSMLDSNYPCLRIPSPWRASKNQRNIVCS